MSSNRPKKRLLTRFLLLLAAALLVAYATITIGLTEIYVQNLLRPPCADTPDTRTGYQSITLTTTDGVKLKGWWKGPQNGAVILLMGGNGATRDTMLPEADFLSAQGYGILTSESRSCAGAVNTLGARETQDALSMLAYAQSQPGVEWVGGLGFSAGGAAMLEAAAQNPNLRAVVNEGNYANLYTEFTNSAGDFLSYEWQIDHLTALLFQLHTGFDSRLLSPIDSIAHIAPRPVFLIFGSEEIGNARGEDQYRSAGEPRQLWVMEGVDHGGYFQAEPQEYPRRILEFFEAARAAVGAK